MNWLDYVIIVTYLGGFLGLGYFFKDNKSSKDYFLGGRNVGWFPLSLSVMATQLSAISFISAPAFVELCVMHRLQCYVRLVLKQVVQTYSLRSIQQMVV